MANVFTATADMFSLDINNQGSQPVNLAIIPGHYPTIKLQSTVSGGTTSYALNFASVSELNNDGIPVQAVVDDGDQSLPGGTLTCSATRPEKTIRSFLNYIKTNPKGVAMISLRSPAGNVNVFKNTFQLQKTNPFNQPERIPINAQQFFSPMQYQDTRIDIDMTSAMLNLDDTLLLFLTIPANTQMGIDFIFTVQPFPYLS